jgi:nitrogen fixation protein NifQ
MDALDAYHALTGGKAASFDQHVLASILALSLHQAAAESKPVYETAGYEGMPPTLAALFPQAQTVLAGYGTLRRSEDEFSLLDLLSCNSSGGTALEQLLAGLIARRAQRPNHLWQDLGLRNRGELSALMAQHFAPLARANKSDMKWKKFFFRAICRDAAYSLCTAPSCSECCDFDNCFGEESGESLLARLRLQAETCRTS